jgi:hypothetical protein
VINLPVEGYNLLFINTFCETFYSSLWNAIPNLVLGDMIFQDGVLVEQYSVRFLNHATYYVYSLDLHVAGDTQSIWSDNGAQDEYNAFKSVKCFA